MTTSSEYRISRRKVSEGGAIWSRTAFGVMVKISSVRVVESRLSRSDIGWEIVWVDARFKDVDAVSLENRSLNELSVEVV